MSTTPEVYEFQPMSNEDIAHTHPGYTLAESLEELGLTPYRLAKSIGISQSVLSMMLEGRTAITVGLNDEPCPLTIK